MKCIIDNCQTSASFNYKDMWPRYCNKHKKETMFNVKEIICYNNNCNRIAYYNLSTKSKAKYCSKHKLKDMVNFRAAKCKHGNCYKYPGYNYQGLKNKYCFDHKKRFMVYIKKQHACKLCKVRASYNYINMKPALYCATHKLSDMINIYTKRCKHANCNVIPFYNYIGSKQGLYCTKHKLDLMIHIRNQRYKI